MDLVKSSIIKASAFTALLLFVGILVGLQMDDARGAYIEGQLKESDLRMQNFLVTQNYLDDSSQNYCKLVERQIPELSQQNTRIGQNLQSFTGRSISNQENYKYLVRRYYVNQLRLYNVLSNYKERCGANTTLIFYFFDDSTNSQRQGAVLTEYYRSVDNSSYIFSFNLEKNRSSAIELLKQDYGIEEGPSIVINGNQTYNEYVPLKQLRSILRNDEEPVNNTSVNQSEYNSNISKKDNSTNTSDQETIEGLS